MNQSHQMRVREIIYQATHNHEFVTGLKDESFSIRELYYMAAIKPKRFSVNAFKLACNELIDCGELVKKGTGFCSDFKRRTGRNRKVNQYVLVIK